MLKKKEKKEAKSWKLGWNQSETITLGNLADKALGAYFRPWELFKVCKHHHIDEKF